VGDGTGKDEGAGVDWQDESLQFPLSSVLNSCAAHQDFAHQAWSQMNLQSDAIAARGGSYLAYQFHVLVLLHLGRSEELAAPILLGAELVRHTPTQFVAHESAV